MDLKIVNALVATVLKIDVDGVEVSVSYSCDKGDQFQGDCRVYDDDNPENTDITNFIFNTNIYYVDTLEKLIKVVEKVKEYNKRVAHEKRFNPMK